MFKKEEAFLLTSKEMFIHGNKPIVDMNDFFENTIFTNFQVNELLNYNFDKGVYITKTALLTLLKRIKKEHFIDCDTVYFNKNFMFSKEFMEEEFLFEVKQHFLY
jgi:hypothetical protein